MLRAFLVQPVLKDLLVLTVLRERKEILVLRAFLVQLVLKVFLVQPVLKDLLVLTVLMALKDLLARLVPPELKGQQALLERLEQVLPTPRTISWYKRLATREMANKSSRINSHRRHRSEEPMVSSLGLPT